VTANTQFNKLIHALYGFERVKDANVLLMQEVSNPSRDNLNTVLNTAGFNLINVAGIFGLAIALVRLPI
jgi:hypothetical protein